MAQNFDSERENEAIDRFHILILIGKSASGKDTIQKELVKNHGFVPLISTTSRPMREGEKNGVDYYFVSKLEFQKRILDNDFLEYRAYNTLVDGKPDTWYYGTQKRELHGEFVTVLDPEGARAFVNYYGPKHCSVCHVGAPDNVREDRARLRGSFDKTEWDRRLLDDFVKFSPNELSDLVDYEVFNNDNLLPVIDRIMSVENDRREFEDFVFSDIEDLDRSDNFDEDRGDEEEDGFEEDERE